MMEYRKLGKSDLDISRIGFGTMSLELNNPHTENLLLQALDGGINYFDTADMYQQGMNETILGRAFLGKRNQVVLATKVGNQWRDDGSGWDWNPSKKYILSALEQSLQRLQTDYIDLYQLHGGTMQDPIDDIVEAFELLKSAGKIRYYGISSIRPNIIREYVKRSAIVSVMMQYSLLDRRPEEEMLPFLYENKVGVLARGVLAKGLLVSKPAEPFLNYSTEQVAEAARRISEISLNDRSSTATSIHFALNHPSISSVVIGIRTKDQLKNALDSNSTQSLTEIEIKAVSGAVPSNYYEQYR
jgi:aryl-alcohol dehydrogenase-like predicted oxidoreductase